MLKGQRRVWYSKQRKNSGPGQTPAYAL